MALLQCNTRSWNWRNSEAFLAPGKAGIKESDRLRGKIHESVTE
jgi:hypothetical protein